jgi:zinc transporter 14
MSLAKLCPLVLFPLHEDEAQCMVRRDDRPPMITVWAFATLFVTIVCFCSLIGLSITPLLGHSPADSSGGSSEASGPAGNGDGCERLRMNSQSPFHAQQHNNRRQQHKASLTLFEGLAVGSLVGSALFSLIPQAFELQERESNQGFLLKAFIIFSGIYLFFLSERIMRIILDTRQKRKKKKRLNHRSSTTAAVVDLVHHHQSGANHLLRPVNTHHHQQQQHSQATTFSTSTTAESQQRYPRPSTSSRGSGSRSGGNRLQRAHAKQQQVVLAASATNRQNIGSGNKSQATVIQKTRRPAVVAAVTQPPIIEQLTETMRTVARQSRKSTSNHEDQPDHDVRAFSLESPTIRRKKRASGAKKGQQRKRAARHLHRLPPHAHHAQQQQRRKRTSQQRAEKIKLQRRERRPLAAAAISPESEPDDYYHHDDLSSISSSSSSSTSSSSSSSFSSYALRGRRTKEGFDVTTRQHTEDSRADYSSSSSSGSSRSKCSSCSSFDRDFCGATLNPSDSDDDNDQRRAVSKQMSEISRRHAQKQLEAGAATNSPTRTTFKFDVDDNLVGHDVDPVKHMGPIYVNRITQHGRRHADGHNHQKQDISTVAWMIILGDGLHNFIDGISIGAAFSESILSGVSISVAVICEEFPHELGDFAVLVSSGMTVRQALGYNFLSACTCYLGMAVGIILGDVNDGASYISALAAGVFLYIALVDMMGELSAALESSSRDSIARTLKLLLLQNVGIAIGISIIFVLSFIDF